MTRRNPSRSFAAFTLSRAVAWGTLPVLTGAMMLMSVAPITGCEEKKPPAPPPEPPPPPPIPPAVNTDVLMQSAKPDSRVQFPRSETLRDESLARVIIQFADAFAKGDAVRVGEMLSEGDRSLLAQLESTGAWDESTARIEAVRVVTVLQTPGDVAEAMSALVVFAVQEPGSAYPIAWLAEKINGKWLFSGYESENEKRRRASDFDGFMPGVQAPEAAPVDPASPAPTPAAPGGVGGA